MSNILISDNNNDNNAETTAFFPLFINMEGRQVLIIGGGKIAERRIKTLLSFGAKITVVSSCLTKTIEKLVADGLVNCVCKEFEDEDMTTYPPFLIIAATNNRSVNHMVKEAAEKSGILVIVSDRRKDCSCYFPAVSENNEYIAGVTSKNGNHTGVKKMAKRIRELFANE